jgi:hypothetical protein
MKIIKIMKFQARNLNPWSLEIEIWDLPFDWAQGGESFDFAQDREPVERPVEPFGISGLSGLGCD